MIDSTVRRLNLIKLSPLKVLSVIDPDDLSDLVTKYTRSGQNC